MDGDKDVETWNTALIIVRNPPPQEVHLNKEDKATLKLTTCCCADSGEAKIEVQYERDVYFPGETANAMAMIDNSKCKKNVKNILFSLEKELNF
jgi:sporulation-control protein spo0M